ncbi:MAG: DUF433 domain-containing protein [Actinomycetota bacterium]
MAFTVPITSVLSGATPRQLGYWRRPTARGAAPLLVPAAKREGRYLYSWADVVALRSIVYLRQEKSLHKIRKAVATLQDLESADWEHLAEYKLVRTAQTIIVLTPKGDMLDLERAPGTVFDEVLMEDVLDTFETRSGQLVPALRRPRPYLTVHPQILAGYPVIADSRVPFHLVATLADDGMDAAEIVEIYPSIDARGIPDAQYFARQVAAAA